MPPLIIRYPRDEAPKAKAMGTRRKMRSNSPNNRYSPDKVYTPYSERLLVLADLWGNTRYKSIANPAKGMMA
jgi:hypothetical protein